MPKSSVVGFVMVLATRLFELLYTLVFGLIIYQNSKLGNKQQIAELLSIAGFALILEYLSIKIYDAYQYSAAFVFQIGTKPDNVPIVIALAWALIINTSMKICDIINIKDNARPFLDTLLALTIDLSMDVIAIRIEGGLWTWKLPLSNTISFDSFMGVRYGNFIGWFFIVLVFSYLLRKGRKYFDKPSHYYTYFIIIPLFAFIPFYLMFEIIQQGKSIFNFRWYYLFSVIILVTFAIIYVIRNYHGSTQQPNVGLSMFELLSYYGFHLYFALAYLGFKIFETTPLIIFPSIVAASIHDLIHMIFLDNLDPGLAVKPSNI